MPEEEKKDVPMVDIDSSGPDAEVELKDEANESEAVESTEDTSAEAVATEPQDASDEQQEKDTKKEELEDYSKDVQRRIAKLTKKWREAERQRDEALNFARTQKKLVEESKKKYSSLEKTSLEDRKIKIKQALAGAQARLAKARHDDDMTLETEILRDISRLGLEEQKVLDAEKAQAEAPQEPVKQDDFLSRTEMPRQPQTVEADPKAEEWGAKNKWFGTDKPMTYTAFDLHETLVNQEGYDPSSDEYYSELDKRMKLAFPHKFGNNNSQQGDSAKPVQTVASATRSTKTGRKTIRLTPTEVAIAKKLGVSLEDYAKQKKLMKEV